MFKNGIGFCQLLSLIQESTIHAGNTGFALRKNRTLHFNCLSDCFNMIFHIVNAVGIMHFMIRS